MAKFLRRIGTKAFKFQAEAFIEKLEFNPKTPCQVSILWKRGTKLLPNNHMSQVIEKTRLENWTLIQRLTV